MAKVKGAVLWQPIIHVNRCFDLSLRIRLCHHKSDGRHLSLLYPRISIASTSKLDVFLEALFHSQRRTLHDRTFDAYISDKTNYPQSNIVKSKNCSNAVLFSVED